MTFDAAAVRHAYGAMADEYAAKFGDDLEVNDFDRAIVDRAIARVPPGGVVLDVGCGPGQVSRRALSAGATPTGVDLTPAMLSVARHRLPRLPLTCGDVRALPYRHGAVDAAIAWYALHNLPRSLMPSALGELRRVLRRGGVAVVATHGGHGEEAVQQRRDGRLEAVVITYYEAGELAALAAEHGLEPADVQERPPQDHELPARKLYLTAIAT